MNNYFLIVINTGPKGRYLFTKGYRTRVEAMAAKSVIDLDDSKVSCVKDSYGRIIWLPVKYNHIGDGEC